VKSRGGLGRFWPACLRACFRIPPIRFQAAARSASQSLSAAIAGQVKCAVNVDEIIGLARRQATEVLRSTPAVAPGAYVPASGYSLASSRLYLRSSKWMRTLLRVLQAECCLGVYFPVVTINLHVLPVTIVSPVQSMHHKSTCPYVGHLFIKVLPNVSHIQYAPAVFQVRVQQV
jgi:hypothetical protein